MSTKMSSCQPFTVWEDVVRRWDDEELELALSMPTYAESGEGDKTVHDFVRDEQQRRASLCQGQLPTGTTPVDGAAVAARYPLVTVQVGATRAPRVKTLPPIRPYFVCDVQLPARRDLTPLDEARDPFYAKHRAQRWVDEQWRVYTNLKLEQRRAWDEARPIMDESLRWRLELEADKAKRKSHWACYLGYSQMSNELYAEAQRASYAAKRHLARLMPHWERYKQQYGDESQLQVKAPTTELSALQAQVRDNDETPDSPVGTLTFERYHEPEDLDAFAPGERPSRAEQDYTCYVCGSNSHTGYQSGARCHTYECPNYGEPMMTLEFYQTLLRREPLRKQVAPDGTVNFVRDWSKPSEQVKQRLAFEEYVLDGLGFPDMETYYSYVKLRGGYEGWLDDQADWHVRQMQQLKQGRLYQRMLARRQARVCPVCQESFSQEAGGLLCPSCQAHAKQRAAFNQRARLWRRDNLKRYRAMNVVPRARTLNARGIHKMPAPTTYITQANRQELALLELAA